MTDKTLKYLKGDVIVFTEGCYSDFDLIGFMIAVEDIDLEAKAKEWKEEAGEFSTRWGDQGKFVSWLTAKGFTMPVHYSTVHMGDYEFELSDDDD